MDNAIKYKILEKIIESRDEILLNEIKSLLDLSEEDFWGSLPSEVKQAIEESKSELDRGLGMPNSKVMADVKSRFLNQQ